MVSEPSCSYRSSVGSGVDSAVEIEFYAEDRDCNRRDKGRSKVRNCSYLKLFNVLDPYLLYAKSLDQISNISVIAF
ncbi:hypothetical protein E3N88_27427 [Mikania micrantha]|uniref:Uncharacterized protein n=1 Tax=Mikania micrantha TaxID=192012 RepID=A0A5N6MXN8_9ASTR|nr:hypothetical protein E3N88_27427 [Mikania micrantha]